ncbi:MAG TPA: sialate O-acetylesterase [Puia sp.]|nr:sialate O-acetylesterase [Puia sp.]
MRQRLLVWVGTAALCLFTTGMYAGVRLPAIISSNMVLQRDAGVSVWGWADKGERIRISTSWQKDPVQVIADSNGNWSAIIRTTGSRKPQTIRIHTHNQDISIGNILFGEVWLCSGQSNMDIPLGGYPGQPVYGAQEAMVSARDNNIRLFKVGQQASLNPVKDVQTASGWVPAAPETVRGFSAVAYLFGKRLQQILGVPVGLIQASWGGSLIEAWMSKEALSPIRQFDLDKVDLRRGNRFPTVLFNAMIHPLIPYHIKGVIWYQGEANISQPRLYTQLFPAMVRDWRRRWGTGDFPFYYVQIAPFAYSDNNRMDDPDNAAFLREAQLRCLGIIPNSGMAVTLDIGTEHIIHPPDKSDVADRLLYNALHGTYGFQGIDCSGPVLDSMHKGDSGIYLAFRHSGGGLYARGKLQGFEIAGPDRVFYPAEASISSTYGIFAKSDRVPDPVAVRYAWRSWTTATLFNNDLLPASSFRTDDWDNATAAQKPSN